jgi:hypothetical protein
MGVVGSRIELSNVDVHLGSRWVEGNQRIAIGTLPLELSFRGSGHLRHAGAWQLDAIWNGSVTESRRSID